MHEPVLLNEAIDFLNIQKGKIYVDCTLGLGGHSIEILKKLENEGTLIGIEQDESALEIAKERLKQFNNYYLSHSNFLELKNVLKDLNVDKITGGVLLDLGVNSIHLDKADRGFSFKSNGLLDMRMDRKQPLTAEIVVNKYKEQELADIIYKFGEERYSRRIARTIVQSRPIKTTNELANLIFHCYPKGKRFKIHPATRTFQALRIEVNKELENLEKFLCFIPELLLPTSRLIVISFHSLEDRIVKHFLRGHKGFKILTKKPVTPSNEEVGNNPRARSAKLRAAEKCKKNT